METRFDYNQLEGLTFEEQLDKLFDPLDNDFITEDIFSFTADVNYIWSLCKDALDHYKQNPEEVYNNLVNGINGNITISSSDLKSKICKQNPVEIKIGFSRRGNFYSPEQKLIGISFNTNAILFLGKEGFKNLKKAEKQYPGISTEFSSDSLKGTISHELSHWLRDTFNNKVISREIEKQKKNI